MQRLYFVLIAWCMIAAFACELCSIATLLILLAVDLIGVFLDVKQIKIPRLSKFIGVILFFGLVFLDAARGGGYQAFFLNSCLDLVWSMIGYRAINKESLTDRLQMGILSLIPLACVAVKLDAAPFLLFLLAYFAIWSGFLIEQSMVEPSSGSSARIQPNKVGSRLSFWISTTLVIALGLTIGTLLFLVVPRYSNNLATLPGLEKGYGKLPDVDLDKTGTIDLDPTLMFRADVPEHEENEDMYWRVEIQNVFDGKQWRSYSGPRREQQSFEPFEHSPENAYHVSFSHDWFDGRIPTLTHEKMVYLDIPAEGDGSKPHLSFASDATWQRWGRPRTISGYDYWISPVSVRDLSVQKDNKIRFESRWIWPGRTRDEELKSRFTRLSMEIVGNARTNYDKAIRIRDYLKENFEYSLDRPEREGNIVEDFLYRQKFGHCEVFSTTMAVLLARLDVPVRNVTGFVSNEYFDEKNYVRAAHAHSWVEVWIDDEHGWTIFDPTPSGGQTVKVDWITRFNDWFISYDTRDFYKWFLANYMILIFVLIGLILFIPAFVLSFRAVRRRLASPEMVAQNAWNDLQKHLKYGKNHNIPLEKWWAGEFDSSLIPAQELAKKLIHLCYRPHDGEYSISQRFKVNGDTLRLYKKAVHSLKHEK